MLQGGQILAGRYVLLRKLGEGRATQVWQARDREVGADRVLKILVSGEPAAGGGSFHEKIDAFGRRLITGRNLAAGKPYTVSVPSETNWGAGDPQGAHYGPIAIGRPDEKVKQQCTRRGQRIAELTKRLFP